MKVFHQLEYEEKIFKYHFCNASPIIELTHDIHILYEVHCVVNLHVSACDSTTICIYYTS